MRASLDQTAQALVAHHKGILAADESPPTIGRRLADVGVVSTPETRRAYRHLLFSTPGLGRHISGAILDDETLRQNAPDGTPFAKLLEQQRIRTGIKVDSGAKPLAGCPGDLVTEGLDGLRERLAEYDELGAQFAKWRAAITIGADLPSEPCLAANAHALARYAALCQEAGLVPIVEPAVLMDGGHDIETCEDVTTALLRRVFAALAEQRVEIEGIILKPNMVLSGRECLRQAGATEVAERTLRCLKRTVPAAVPGIVFLSGGQNSEDVTTHLTMMNARFGPHPWPLSFSCDQALQEPALRAWRGAAENCAAAQELLLRRVRLNSAAAAGAYTGEVA